MAKKLAAKVLEQRQVAAGVYRLLLQQPWCAQQARPGQFVHVHCGFAEHALLRRPLSIHAADRDQGTIALLYRVVGRGTRFLAQLQPGDTLDLLGPLGTGFPLGMGKSLIIGGGLGVAPLYFLTQELTRQGTKPALVLGFSNSDQAQLGGLFEPWSQHLVTATMDGSTGYHGTAVDAARQFLSSNYHVIYACGPLAMLQALPQPQNTAIYVSLEEKMACGVGACLGCAVPARAGGYLRACKDGPVFNLQEVVLHE